MVNRVINPGYKHLRSFVEQISEIFPQGKEIIYKGRNEIKVFELDGLKIAVKSFKKPHFINRIAYTFFRKSKAKRSYEHALKLVEKGIPTPAPVAYVENKKNLLISDSYFISIYKEYPGMMREFRYCPLKGKEDLVSAFARFTAFVHDQDVLHLDYSPGNILYEENTGEYDFCLVDINRMKFGKVDMETGCYNLRRLWGSNEMIIFLAKEYAGFRNLDKEKCIALTLKYHQLFWEKYSRRHEGFQPYQNEVRP